MMMQKTRLRGRMGLVLGLCVLLLLLVAGASLAGDSSPEGTAESPLAAVHNLVDIEDSEVPLGPYVALGVEMSMNYGEAIE